MLFMYRIGILIIVVLLGLPALADQGDLERFETVINYLEDSSKSQPERGLLLSVAESALSAPLGSVDLSEALMTANDEGELQRKVITAVLETLDDPWARLYDPEQVSKVRGRLQGDAKAAMGVTVLPVESPKGYRVVGVSPGSPADGTLFTGDTVIWANGIEADDEAFREATRGVAGQRLHLKVVDELGTTREVSLTLADFDAPTAYLVDRDRGLIRISSFGPHTAKELRQAMRQLDGAPAIIDLRFNGGGYVTAAVECSDLFLPTGATVVTTVSPKKTEVHVARDDISFRQPVCLLVNGRTASAAEIFVAALRSYNEVYVVGDKTYGKGSVQRLVSLPGNWALKYTTSLYKTPAGEYLDKVGLEPDKHVEMELTLVSSSKDSQLAEAVAWVDSHRKVAITP
jgi:carboxyl-terminal processing protease